MADVALIGLHHILRFSHEILHFSHSYFQKLPFNCTFALSETNFFNDKKIVVMKLNKRTRIAAFIFVTFAWSFFCFQIRPFDGLMNVLPFSIFILLGWIPALGLFFMGKLMRNQMKTIKKTTYLGTNKPYSLAMATLPILCLTVFGVSNSANIQPNLFGFYMGIIILLYATFEEYGWRGYLQSELTNTPKWIKYTIIGCLWFAWHWSFLPIETIHIGNLLFMCGLLILASIGIGDALKQTQSVLVSATFHSLGNIAMTSNLMGDNFSSTGKIVTIIAVIIAWIYLAKRWNSSKKELLLQLD